MAEKNRLPEKGRPGIYKGKVTKLGKSRRGLPLVRFQDSGKICFEQTLEIRGDPDLDSVVNVEDLMEMMGLGFGIIEDGDELADPDEFPLD